MELQNNLIEQKMHTNSINSDFENSEYFNSKYFNSENSNLENSHNQLAAMEETDRIAYEQAMEITLEKSVKRNINLYSSVLPTSEIESILKNRCKFNYYFDYEYISSGFADLSNSKYKFAQVKRYRLLEDNTIADELIANCNFPISYIKHSSWNFVPAGNFKSEQERFKIFLDKSKEFVINNFLIDDSKSVGLLLQGDVGVGKSSLLSLIAKLLYKYLRVRVYYTTASEYLNAFSTNDISFMQRIKHSQFLFLDALGQEHYNENRISAMFDLFHHRYSNRDKLHTFIAGNFDIKEWRTSGDALYTQISDYCNDKTFVKILNFEGKSKRTQIV